MSNIGFIIINNTDGYTHSIDSLIPNFICDECKTNIDWIKLNDLPWNYIIHCKKCNSYYEFPLDYCKTDLLHGDIQLTMTKPLNKVTKKQVFSRLLHDSKCSIKDV